MKTDPNEVRFPAPAASPALDTDGVIKFYKLPCRFPDAVLKEAKAIPARVTWPKDEKRLDLRKKFIFTCDPETARDYDDALSLEKNRKGELVLGVHIADVSHYVRPGSALDREAYKRSTSVYFCDRVIPMLPESLSNGVCSLVPNEDRLAFSVFMTFDKSGEMVARSFAKSVIRSKARFTYEEVMAILKGGASKKASRSACATIRAIADLAMTMRARRFKAGALDLEMPEPEVLLDANGEMSSIITRPYDESHQMVEECMVAANEAVAKELWTRGVKILARLHDAPDPEKILLLRSELRGLGVKMGNIENPKVFAAFLQSIKRHPLYATISVMILRSMKRAVYDAESIGHFGLAKKYYAHFTSPIRRYPDLTLHRQLAAYLAANKNPVRAKVPPKTLAKWAEHTSFCEERATEAERSLLEIKKYRFLDEQITSRQILDYDAVVSRVMPFGCFVEIPTIATSGLVHVSHLSHRYLTFNESDRSLSAPGGESWHVGDRLRVRVAHVDFRERKIDFVPVRDEKRGARAASVAKKGKRHRG